jgi:hypothetical protein
VERPDGPLGVLFQVIEVRREEPVADPVENAQVDLEQLLHPVEDASDRRRIVGPGQLAHVAIGDEIDVEFGPDGAHDTRQQRAEVRGVRFIASRQVRSQKLLQVGQGVDRAILEPIGNHDSLHVVIDESRQHGVFKAADHHRFVDELIGIAPQAANRFTQPAPL